MPNSTSCELKWLVNGEGVGEVVTHIFLLSHKYTEKKSRTQMEGSAVQWDGEGRRIPRSVALGLWAREHCLLENPQADM